MLMLEILTIYERVQELCVALEITAQITEGKFTPGNYLINVLTTALYYGVFFKKTYIEWYFVKSLVYPKL